MLGVCLDLPSLAGKAGGLGQAESRCCPLQGPRHRPGPCGALGPSHLCL